MPVHRELCSEANVFIDEAICGSGGDGNGELHRSAMILCTPHRAPLDVTSDKVCKEQKETTQQKQEDSEKGRHAGLIS